MYVAAVRIQAQSERGPQMHRAAYGSPVNITYVTDMLYLLLLSARALSSVRNRAEE